MNQSVVDDVLQSQQLELRLKIADLHRLGEADRVYDSETAARELDAKLGQSLGDPTRGT